MSRHFALHSESVRDRIYLWCRTISLRLIVEGTVNTGAFDDLHQLSLIAESENMWLHVDGAFGSLIVLDPERRHLVTGIDRADSIAFDFHKWFHCPYDAGCVLIRHADILHDTFSINSSYLIKSPRGCASEEPTFANCGPDLSRSFRALKVWFTLKEHGTIKLGQKIADNCRQAQYLVSLLEKHDALVEIIRPVSLNIVNFRFKAAAFRDAGPEMMDSFNNDLAADLQISGIALTSTTRIHQRQCIRVAILSHRATLADFDIFVEAIMKLYRARLEADVQQHA